MFKDVFAKLDQMTHEVNYFGLSTRFWRTHDWTDDGPRPDFVEPKIYQAATIRYVVKGDDAEKDAITIPGFAVFSTRVGDDGRRRCYRAETFLDPSPVFRRIGEKFGGD